MSTAMARLLRPAAMARCLTQCMLLSSSVDTTGVLCRLRTVTCAPIYQHPYSIRSSLFLASRVVHNRALIRKNEEKQSTPISDRAPRKDRFGSTNSGFFVRWEIPWNGLTVLKTMTAFGISFIVTGFGVATVAGWLLYRQMRSDETGSATAADRQINKQMGPDEGALFMFVYYCLQLLAGLSVINLFLKSYKPFPYKLFYYGWKDPFSLSRGWVLWGGLGMLCAVATVLSAGALHAYVHGGLLPRKENDSVSVVLPLVGASQKSIALLLVVTGILGPVLEEIFFRGFLMTSLTKWVPTYAAILLSAAAFVLWHGNSGRQPQIFTMGAILGFSYAKTGYLLTPLMIHGLWNAGTILLLRWCQLKGYDVEKMIWLWEGY